MRHFILRVYFYLVERAIGIEDLVLPYLLGLRQI